MGRKINLLTLACLWKLNDQKKYVTLLNLENEERLIKDQVDTRVKSYTYMKYVYKFIEYLQHERCSIGYWVNKRSYAFEEH